MQLRGTSKGGRLELERGLDHSANGFYPKGFLKDAPRQLLRGP